MVEHRVGLSGCLSTLTASALIFAAAPACETAARQGKAGFLAPKQCHDSARRSNGSQLLSRPAQHADNWDSCSAGHACRDTTPTSSA